jgi:polysaccharide chain length determinant protein (PEP-CTERM system associated)
MRKRLEEVEGALRHYRQKHRGELPEQLETNLRVIDRFQLQLNEKQQTLRDAKNRLIALEKKMEEFKSAQETKDVSTDIFSSTDLMHLNEKLVELKLRYTESHPDVIRIRKKIEELQSGKTSSLIEGPANLMTPQEAYKQQKAEILSEIKNIQIENSKVNNEINMYQQRVEMTPKREEELMSLMRDYRNIQSSYSSLLNRKLEAEIAVNMERKQKGEQFRIIDRARLPEKPVSPNMKKLFLFITAAGLGIGCGLVLLLDYLDTALRQPEEFETELEIPVIATIPRVLHPKDIRRQEVSLAFSIVSVLIASALFAGFAMLTVIKGVDPTLDIVRRFISI